MPKSKTVTQTGINRDRKSATRNAQAATSKASLEYWRRRVFIPHYVRGGVRIASGNYAVEIQHGGRRRRLSLLTPNRAAAAERAHQLFLLVQSSGWDAALAEFRPPAEPVSKDRLTVGEYLAFIRAHSELSASALGDYARSLRTIVASAFGYKEDSSKHSRTRHAEWLARVDGVRLAELTPSVIRSWKRDFLARVGDNPVLLRRARTSANSYLRRAQGAFVIESDAPRSLLLSSRRGAIAAARCSSGSRGGCAPTAWQASCGRCTPAQGVRQRDQREFWHLRRQPCAAACQLAHHRVDLHRLQRLASDDRTGPVARQCRRRVKQSASGARRAVFSRLTVGGSGACPAPANRSVSRARVVCFGWRVLSNVSGYLFTSAALSNLSSFWYLGARIGKCLGRDKGAEGIVLNLEAFFDVGTRFCTARYFAVTEQLLQAAEHEFEDTVALGRYAFLLESVRQIFDRWRPSEEAMPPARPSMSGSVTQMWKKPLKITVSGGLRGQVLRQLDVPASQPRSDHVLRSNPTRQLTPPTLRRPPSSATNVLVSFRPS
jgi:hypothetical protein